MLHRRRALYGGTKFVRKRVGASRGIRTTFLHRGADDYRGSRAPALFVAARGLPERLGDALPQALGREHLDVCAELQDLHHQLAVVRVRHLQQVAAVRVEARALLRVPALRRHPARRLGREAQARPLHLAAGEDAVAGAQVLVQLGGGDFLRPRVAQLGGADGVDREAAQGLADMAVTVDIPVAAVVHQALRRDLALGLAVVLAVVVADPEARAP